MLHKSSLTKLTRMSLDDEMKLETTDSKLAASFHLNISF